LFQALLYLGYFLSTSAGQRYLELIFSAQNSGKGNLPLPRIASGAYGNPLVAALRSSLPHRLQALCNASQAGHHLLVSASDFILLASAI